MWGHVRRWAGIMIAVILVKPVIVIVLGLAGALSADDGPDAFSAVVSGLAIILLAIFASAMIYRFVPGFGDEIVERPQQPQAGDRRPPGRRVISSPAALVSQGIKTHSGRGGGGGGGGGGGARPANPVSGGVAAHSSRSPGRQAAPRPRPAAASGAAPRGTPAQQPPAPAGSPGSTGNTQHRRWSGVDDPVPHDRAPPYVSDRPRPAERDRRQEPGDRRDRADHRRRVPRHDERTARPGPAPCGSSALIGFPLLALAAVYVPYKGRTFYKWFEINRSLQAHPAPRHRLPLRRHGGRASALDGREVEVGPPPGIGRISWLAAPFGPDEIAVLLHADRRTVTAAIEIEGPGVGLRDSEDQEALVDRFGTLLKHVANGDGFVTRLQMLARTLPADPDAHAKDVAQRGDRTRPGWLQDSYDQLQSMVSTSSEQHRAYLVACMHYTRELAAEANAMARADRARSGGRRLDRTPASPSSWPAS